MKIRTGFVSNSSSSSFCIYGTYFDGVDSFIGSLKEPKKFWDAVKKEYSDSFEEDELKEIIKDQDYCQLDDFTYFIGKYLDLEVESPYGEGLYIGESWSSVGDNQTGKQFKEEIEEKIKSSLKTKKFDTLVEAWRDG